MIMNIPVAYHFRVDFIPLADPMHIRFQEVSGISSEIVTKEIQQGFEMFPVAQSIKQGSLVLKRGMATGSLISNMFYNAMTTMQYKNLTVMVTLLNDESEPLTSWKFFGAAPKKWSVNDFNAESNTLAIESMEFSYQRLHMT